MIDGVEVKKLSIHNDDRGSVMEILRCDEPIFEKFGQVYVTGCNPGIAKAWHFHKGQSEYFTCVKGVLKLVLYDGRQGSKTNGQLQEFFISDKNPLLVKIPALVCHGFECGTGESLIAVCVKTEPYNPKEPDKVAIPFNDQSIPYRWDSEKGG